MFAYRNRVTLSNENSADDSIKMYFQRREHVFSRCIHSPSKYPNSPESWLIHEIAVFCASPLRFKILFLINEKPRLHFMHESRGKSRFSAVLSVFTFSVADCSTFVRDRSKAIYFQPRLSFFLFASLD